MMGAERFKPGTEFEVVPTAAGYDRWAEIYDAEDNPLVALEGPYVRQMLGEVRGLRVADLGCGTGRHALWLASEGADVTAVDFSVGMLGRARTKAGWERVRLVEHDLNQTLPLAIGAFDRVLAALVLEHVPDLQGFFAECGRICAPDGYIVASTLHPAMLLRGIQAHFRDPRTGRDVCPAGVAHELSDYVMAALRAGLRIEELREHRVDAALAARSARAAKYRDWPMLLTLRLRR
jgi:malonyl-CoA O-methyltransferase